MLGLEVLPQKETFGSALGTGLGKGIGSTLEGIVKQKSEALANRGREQILEKNGLTPEQSQFINQVVPEKDRWEAIQIVRQYNAQEEQRQQQQQNRGPEQMAGAKEFLEYGNPQEAEQLRQKEYGQPSLEQQTGLQGALQQLSPSNPFGVSQQSPFGLPTSQINAANTERRHQENLDVKKEKLEHNVAKEAREFTKPFIEKSETAKKNIRDYKILQNLAKNRPEELRSGNTHIALEKLGLEGFNRTLTTEIAGKTAARLGLGAASAFGPGAKLTNFLETTFQKTLPNLWNTPKGMETLSGIAIPIEEANELITKTVNDVIKENKGRVPGDIYAQIEERTRDDRDRLENESMSAALSHGMPEAKNYPAQTIVRYKGNKFTQDKGRWLLAGEEE
jgi:hypothetical protein